MCPLCRVTHKADREFIWHFFDQGADQDDALDAVRRAFGFCAEHTGMLSRIDTEGMKSTLAISTMYADTFTRIVDGLGCLQPDAQFRRATCPACVNRSELVRANARYLLDALATNPGIREKYTGSTGLCFAHFELVWNIADAADRTLIGRVQRDAAASLLSELAGHVRKHDHRYRDEPKGSERDAWQRAVLMTAGWPPPDVSASEPEGPR